MGLGRNAKRRSRDFFNIQTVPRLYSEWIFDQNRYFKRPGSDTRVPLSVFKRYVHSKHKAQMNAIWTLWVTLFKTVNASEHI